MEFSRLNRQSLKGASNAIFWLVKEIQIGLGAGK